MPKKFTGVIGDVRAQYLPDGSIELLTLDQVNEEDLGSLFDFAPNMARVVLEKTSERQVISKLTNEVYLKITAPASAYNIGMMSNLTGRILDKLRMEIDVA